MSNDFNVNDFRAQRETETAQKNILIDGLMLVAIVSMGLVGLGLFGYNQFADYNANKAEQADKFMLAYEEGYTGSAEDARANLAVNRKSGLRTGKKETAGDGSDILAQMSKSRDPRMRRMVALQKDAAANAPKNAVEFVMAKGMTGPSAQLVRYRRTVGVLKQCGNGYGKMLSFYENQNRPKYNALKKRIDAKQETTAAQGMSASMSELDGVSDKKSAMKFLASGGANRHMQSSMRMMGSMSAMFGEEEYRGKLSAQDCQSVKQKAQTAQLNIRM